MQIHRFLALRVFAGVAAAFFSPALVANAASVVISEVTTYATFPASPVNPNNLTTQGATDWAYWASATPGSTNLGTTLAPTNEKSDGSAISPISILGSGYFRGSDTADAAARYSWSDGTSPTTGSNQNLAGGLVFSSSLNTFGAGFDFTITGAVAGQTYYVLLYMGGYNATGNLALTLPGVADPVTHTYAFSGASPKTVNAYQIAFQPDNADDQLTVRFTASNTSSNGHIGIDAVAVGTTFVAPVPPIPEPSMTLIGGVGMLALLGCRRRASFPVDRL